MSYHRLPAFTPPKELVGFPTNIVGAEVTSDPVTAFEEYWGASKYRTRNMIGYSDKKCLAWEAYSAALQSLSLPVDIDRSGLAQEVES